MHNCAQTNDKRLKWQIKGYNMAITEEQKKIIESTGHYVIEFKLWFREKNGI